MKKIFFLFYLIILNIFNLSIAKEISNKPIILIDNYIITELDLKKEIEFIIFISKSSNSTNFQQAKVSSIDSLLERKIKDIETNNLKIEILDKEIDISLYNYLKNQRITEEDLNIFYESNEIEKNYLKNIIQIDLKWEKLIRQTYSNRININLTEIEKDLENDPKGINNKELKEKLIIIEQNKILNKFSNIYLEKIKKKYLIKIL
jgi:hypothetical protein